MLWLAHVLTLLRVPLAVIVAVFAPTDRAVAIGAVVAAAVTDAADGNLARFLKRRGHVHPDIGGWLDPLADKIFVALVLVAIVLRTHSFAIGALIGARELLFLPLAALYLARRQQRTELHADPIGKLATIAQFVAVAVVLGAPADSAAALVAAVVAGALGVAAVAHYVRTLIR